MGITAFPLTSVEGVFIQELFVFNFEIFTTIQPQICYDQAILFTKHKFTVGVIDSNFDGWHYSNTQARQTW